MEAFNPVWVFVKLAEELGKDDVFDDEAIVPMTCIRKRASEICTFACVG